jgi:hypothetical protein
VREGITRQPTTSKQPPTVLPTPVVPLGPDVWRNWKAYEQGLTSRGGYEAALYSDAHIVGGPDVGDLDPYQLFNALGRPPYAGPGTLGVGIVARVHWHLPDEPSPDPNGPDRPTKSSADHWIGTPLDDQLACLLSLIMGARIRSGGQIRNFETDAGADPAGRPQFWDHAPPSMTVPRRGSVIPGIAGEQTNLADAAPQLATFSALTGPQATAVLRSARQYRQAIWIADDDCELAWLLMVSAVEAAAAQWHPKGDEPTMLLADQHPELAALLEEGGNKELLARAAKLIPLNRPTAATQSFLQRFATPPPVDNRPDEWARFDFTKLKEGVNLIYKYRSKALHGGQPFPAPLLETPWKGDMAYPTEVPMGHWTQVGPHTTWMAKDLPMLFHTFAALTRRALLAWWAELARQA